MNDEYLEQLIERYKKHSAVALELGDIYMLLGALIKERDANSKPEKWEPKGGEWYVDTVGAVCDVPSDIDCKNYGVEFETREAAEKAAKYYRKIHRLYKLAEELNEGWEPDWGDISQKKYHVAYNHSISEWFMYWDYRVNRSTLYFKDEQTANRAIELIKNGALE